MTTQLDPRIMPAQNQTDSSPTTGTDGEEVKAMTIFESRRARGTRAWDEMSEIDRAVLLEAVRQRRKLREQQQAIHNEMFGLRANRN
ncbi:hypothetical protein [Aeromicrobium sp.]|uniref:hypothetical protein n=1 Tax=Aeromicrobium sp. TaxID=1871063 RepID=UPI003D6AB560